MVKQIAVIEGDGIGPEVIREGVKVLNTLQMLDSTFQLEYTYFPWGCDYYVENGKMMADDGIEQLRSFDAIYLGAVGRPDVPDHISLWDLLLIIRKAFDQYVNLRPVKLIKGAPTVIQHGTTENIDMIFVRENTEGEYSGAGDWLYKGKPNEVVLQTGVFSRHGTERVIRYAFELADRLGKTVTSISKANALNYSMVFWDEIFEEVSQQYPHIPTASYLVDAAAMHMLNDPGRFEVVVTSNLFGDILTDIGAALAGGMGLAAGANLDPERRYPSMFEPVHGSAPDIMGQNKANPLAAIWSASQMCDHFGRTDHGKRIIQAIEDVLVEGEYVTGDMGGTKTTEEVGDRVVHFLKKRYQK